MPSRPLRHATESLLVHHDRDDHEAALILEPTGYWAALTEGFDDMGDPTEPLATFMIIRHDDTVLVGDYDAVQTAADQLNALPTCSINTSGQNGGTNGVPH